MCILILFSLSLSLSLSQCSSVRTAQWNARYRESHSVKELCSLSLHPSRHFSRYCPSVRVIILAISCTHSHMYMYTHAHTHFYTHARTYTLSYTHTHSLSHSLTHPYLRVCCGEISGNNIHFPKQYLCRDNPCRRWTHTGIRYIILNVFYYIIDHFILFYYYIILSLFITVFVL